MENVSNNDRGRAIPVILDDVADTTPELWASLTTEPFVDTNGGLPLGNRGYEGSHCAPAGVRRYIPGRGWVVVNASSTPVRDKAFEKRVAKRRRAKMLANQQRKRDRR